MENVNHKSRVGQYILQQTLRCNTLHFCNCIRFADYDYLCYMDVLTPEQRKRNMRAIKNKNTIIEELLAKALRDNGVRYRRNNWDILGKPDFTLRRLRIAIFCDSEYFHGKDWEANKHRIKTNTVFF